MINLLSRKITKLCENPQELDFVLVTSNPTNGRKERGFVPINALVLTRYCLYKRCLRRADESYQFCRSQKISFSASCISLGSRALEITAKFDAPKMRPGRVKFG